MSLFEEDRKNIPKDRLEKSIQWFRKFAATYPPYNFVINYANNLKLCGENTSEGIFAKRFAWILSNESNRDVNEELRLVELEKDLIGLVESTDNNIFYRPLFFPSVFINNDFRFEGLIIKGVYITECFTAEGSNSYWMHVPKEQINDYAIMAVIADIEQGCEFYSCIALVNKTVGEKFVDSDEENKKLERLNEFLRTIICNVVDMVEGNDEDLNVTIIETSKEQNIKRMKRGQIPTPTKVYIKAKGEFKKYVSNFKRDSEKKLSHKFLVRGHYRHFRDDKFKNMKGKKTWIKPYYKGEGIMIAKEYIIKR